MSLVSYHSARRGEQFAVSRRPDEEMPIQNAHRPLHRSSLAAPHQKEDQKGRERIAALSLFYARTRDPQAREALILHHQKLVHYVAARFMGGGETLDDLIQVGTIGLINALDRFDPTKDIQFSTYAMPTIVGEIKRHFRDKTWHVKVPRGLQELSLNARKVQQKLASRLGRPPSLREVAGEIGASEQETFEALEVSRMAIAVSLDTHLETSSASGGGGATLLDILGSLDAMLCDAEAYADLRDALDALDPRERQVIYLRFFDELPQVNIARQMNISQMHVSRLQQRALERLRVLLAEEACLPARLVRQALHASALRKSAS